jgi:hypothetical protein
MKTLLLSLTMVLVAHYSFAAENNSSYPNQEMITRVADEDATSLGLFGSIEKKAKGAIDKLSKGAKKAIKKVKKVGKSMEKTVSSLAAGVMGGEGLSEKDQKHLKKCGENLQDKKWTEKHSDKVEKHADDLEKIQQEAKSQDQDTQLKAAKDLLKVCKKMKAY